MMLQGETVTEMQIHFHSVCQTLSKHMDDLQYCSYPLQRQKEGEEECVVLIGILLQKFLVSSVDRVLFIVYFSFIFFTV